jgi:signal transduction histidine kinase
MATAFRLSRSSVRGVTSRVYNQGSAMSLQAWLRPPRSLLVILFLLTLVSISAVAFFGWKLLAQESVVEEQRTQERLEHTADRIVVTLRDLLAETGERLAEGTPEVGPVFLLTEKTLSVMPPVELLYRPFSSSDPEAPASVFAEGEALEFQQGQPASAVEWYRRLAASRDPAVRAGALLRLGRVLRRLSRQTESRAAYQQLSEIAGVLVAGEPADLVAHMALGEPIRDDLLRGRWPLTHGQFNFYWSEAARQAGRPEPAPVMSPELEQAAELAWEQRTREPAARGQLTLWVDGRPLFLLWRARHAMRAMLVTPPEALLKQNLAGDEAVFAAVDGEGRVVAGRKDGAGRAVVRTAADSRLPWALYVTRASGFKDAGAIAWRRFLQFGMAVMFIFLIAGTYFIARAIHRENAVSRLQSDFVCAVSHEFRSPLTSMRQLSEMLAFGRTPNEERRQRYYETLVKETERLQRLVEKLLNFGGIEAGKRRYHFEPLDAAPLVEHVAREFEPQIAGSGRLIELHGVSSGCRITADREALSIALRNLVDNALKYSPDSPTVWVEWARENESVAIRVRDKGVGIPPSERKAIFHKFVRGSAAASGGVKGTGVGLAMVYHIVTAHGGEVGVISEPGHGSTFTITLPAVKDL